MSKKQKKKRGCSGCLGRSIGLIVLGFIGLAVLSNLVDSPSIEPQSPSNSVQRLSQNIEASASDEEIKDGPATDAPIPTNTVLPAPTNTVVSVPTNTVAPIPTNTIAPASTVTIPPTPTDAISPSPTNTLLPLPMATTLLENQFLVAQNANLRGGPSIEYDVVGSVAQGEILQAIGKSADGNWYKLTNDAWIAKFLVQGNERGLATFDSPLLADAQVVNNPSTQPDPANVGNPNSNPFECTNGCSVAPDPSCAIKGNVNSKKDRIYHVPGWRDYNRTNVKPEEGDRWFCTEAEAIAAGFRAPLNH